MTSGVMPKRWHRPGRWMGTARLLVRTRRARRLVALARSVPGHEVRPQSRAAMRPAPGLPMQVQAR